MPYTLSLKSVVVFIPTVVSLSYALIRPYSIEKYLKQGFGQAAVVEFQTVKKIIPPILLIYTGVLIQSIVREYIIRGYINPLFNEIYSSILFPASLVFIVLGLAPILMYGLTISKKEFRFYFAKTCFMSALNKKDIFKQMHYFRLGLQEYNRYLKRHLKLQINDIDKIFSKTSLLDDSTKTGVIRSLSTSFETETDKLKPLKYISSEPILMKSEILKVL